MALLEAVIIAGIVGAVTFAAGFVAGLAVGRGRGGPAALPLDDVRALPATLGPGALPAPPLVRDLRVGGLVGLSGFGDEFEDVQLEIERYTRCTRGREEWHELSGTYRSRAVGLDWEVERGEMFLYAMKRLRGEKLSDLGIALEALLAAKPGEHLKSGEEDWTVVGAGKTLAHENGIGFGKELATWELKSADKKKLVRIERWDDEPPAVSRGERVDPATVTIFRTRA